MNRQTIVAQNIQTCLQHGKSVLTPGEFKFVSKFQETGEQFTELRPFLRNKGTAEEALSFFPVKISVASLDPKVFNKLARLAMKVKKLNRTVEIPA